MSQKYIIRTDRAGVFVAEIAERRGSECDLLNAAYEAAIAEVEK